MNIVFVRHGLSREYAFQVSNELSPYIKKGDTLVVVTKDGMDIGVASSNIISGDGAEEVAYKLGAYAPLKPVIGVIPDALRYVVRNEVLCELQKFLSVYQTKGNDNRTKIF